MNQLLLLHMALMAQKKEDVPTDPPVLYDWGKMNNAYINTRVYIANTIAVELTFMSTNNANHQVAFGWQGTSSNANRWYVQGTTNLAINMGASLSVSTSINRKYVFKGDVLNKTLLLQYGTTTSLNRTFSPANASSTAKANTFLYGKVGGASSVYAGNTSKQYGCKIWDNGVLIRDFQPCSCGDRIGFWDHANEKFYPLEEGTMELGND